MRVLSISILALSGRLVREFRARPRRFAIIYLPVLVTMATVAMARLFAGIEVGDLTRDPVQYFDGPAYIGALSLLGGLLWGATTGICLFAAAVLWMNRSNLWMDWARQDARFLLAGGLVTAMLMVDDIYMLHDVVLPDLGVPEMLVFGVMGTALVAFVLWSREAILRHEFLLLALAVAGFGASLFVDATDSTIPYKSTYFWEDGAKLFGIVSWLAYFATTAAARIQAATRPAEAERWSGNTLEHAESRRNVGT